MGWELQLRRPHTLGVDPYVMDARVSQSDGFRFMYVLPFSPTHLLVEDTVFSRRAKLEKPEHRSCIRDYLRKAGIEDFALEREEHGVLPMPWRRTRRPTAVKGVIDIGYRGGFFHPATGFSSGLAAQLASRLAGLETLSPEVATTTVRQFSREIRGFQQFSRHLNRAAFLAPAGFRHRIYSRFYRLPETQISDFYAARMSASNGLTMLSRMGRPLPDPRNPLIQETSS